MLRSHRGAHPNAVKCARNIDQRVWLRKSAKKGHQSRARRLQHQKHGPKPWWVRNRHSQQRTRGRESAQGKKAQRRTHQLHARRRRKIADGAGQPKPRRSTTNSVRAARSACESATTSLERWPRLGCGRECAQRRHSVVTWAEALLHTHGPQASMPTFHLPSRDGRAAAAGLVSQHY